MQDNRLDGCPSTCFLTLLICLQYSDNNFGGSDVSRDALCKPEKTKEFFILIFKEL